MKKIILLSLFSSVLFMACESAKIVKKTEDSGELKALKSVEKWTLIDGDKLAENFQGNPIYIEFNEDETGNRINGFAGCNVIFGGITLTNSGIEINQLGASKKYCPDMSQEQNFIKLLEKANRWRLEGDELKLYKDQIELLRFTKG